MWWQGTDNIPDVVRLCWASLKKHCGTHKIIFITKDNYQDYVTLPDYILPKVNAGHISLTHLSDIIRSALLAKYGGLWVDSTLFVADEIPEDVFSLEYFTIRYLKNPDYSILSVSFYRWATFCFSASGPGSLLFCFTRDMFYEYLKTHRGFIHYLLIDYIFAVAFDEFPEFRSAWENIPVDSLDCLRLLELLNDEWNVEGYADLTRISKFFKTTYKKRFDVRTSEGKETFYGHLLSEYGITPSES